MRHSGSAPVISAAVSGLVIGIVVTLAVTGAMEHAADTPKTLPRGTTVPAPATPRVDLYGMVSRIVVRQLGQSYPNEKQARLMRLNVLPLSTTQTLPTAPLPNHSTFHTVSIVFRLNDHPLGKVWRVRAAKADVYRVLKALFVSGLPIYAVRMTGVFPVPTGRAVENRPVLKAYISHADAMHIAWRKLDRSNEGQLWRSLSATHIDPAFG